MRRSRAVFRDYLEALLIAVIFATFARAWVVQAFKIPTGSMEENLLVGDHILVNKFVFGPAAWEDSTRWLPLRDVQRGDVVVFKYPEDPTRDFIKRCVALPGDAVEIRDKRLAINGQPVDEDSFTYHLDPRTYPPSVFVHQSYRLRDNFGPYVVPEGHYFCLGDNRDNSNDSRFWGPVPASYVKGRAFMIYWSFASDHESVGWPGFRGRAEQLGDVMLKFFTNTRWERSFRIVR